MKNNGQFLEIEKEYSNYARARIVVVPLPYEATTSYGKGTKNGPAAILAASQHVETFDVELSSEPYKKIGIHTLKAQKLSTVGKTINKLVADGKLPIIIGGEHSLTPKIVQELTKKEKNLSVLQLDAHADLRDKYRGRKDSHACVMRRILEICPAVQAGVRSLSEEEYGWAKRSGQIDKIHWAGQPLDAKKICSQLSDLVYITVDVDVFDPSIMPATGTPEPGGLLWNEVISLLKVVSSRKKIVGFDVVELSPLKGQNAPDFMAAKLVYKMIGFIR